MNLIDHKEQFLEILYERGSSGRQWAKQHNYRYEYVIGLLNGRIRGQRGEVRQIRKHIEQELAQAI